MKLDVAIKKCPLIAILRGVQNHEVVAVGNVLVEAGFTMIEVPMNSPNPCQSIKLLLESVGQQCLVGAGTVVNTQQLDEVIAVGGGLIVSPNFDPDIVRATVSNGAVSLPGVATPSEGFAALKAGASGLKLFPAESIEPAVLKAWRAVFAAEVKLFPVGGVTQNNMRAYTDAGASGFGIGSALYKPGIGLDTLAERAKQFVDAL